MQIALGVLVSCCLGMALAEGEVPECLGMTEDELAQLKSLVVTEDIQDKLVVDGYHAVWGPKAFVEGDENACFKYSWTKTEDTHLTMVLHGKGAWFDGESIRNLTAEKVGNGVYLLKANGKTVSKEYHLSDKQHVRATFVCLVQALPPGSKEAAIPHFSVVGVHAHDMKTPMDADVQAEVDEVVKKVQDHKDLLGEIVHYTHAC